MRPPFLSRAWRCYPTSLNWCEWSTRASQQVRPQGGWPQGARPSRRFPRTPPVEVPTKTHPSPAAHPRHVGSRGERPPGDRPVQHTRPPRQGAGRLDPDRTFQESALHGSSHFDLRGILRWFTASIMSITFAPAFPSTVFPICCAIIPSCVASAASPYGRASPRCA